MLAIASDGALVHKRDFTFLHWVTAEEEARVAVAELDRRQLGKIAMISTEHPGALAIRDAILKLVSKERVLLDETANHEIRDFRSNYRQDSAT